MSSHRKTTRSMLLGGAALAGALILVTGPAAAQEARQYDFNFPAQPLSSALQAYGATADQQLMFADADVQGRTAPALEGSYTAEDALRQLLAGTGLHVRRTEFGVLQISRTADPQGGSAGGGADDYNAVEALVVTAQKKGENIQDVPIAISAFTMDQLDAQKIEGGFDLLKAVPNVTFSKTNFTGYNFQIRGIGTQAISATTDPGVAVAMNNTTLIVNRLFEQEYVDIERVEVLRGPQGTLYGRNATGGVINVISAKPVMGDLFGELKLEAGNFNAQRVRGHVNVPIGDALALRAAYASTVRDGYGYNEYDGSDVDDRDLWTGRVTLGWEPSERFRANLLWEHFEEEDERVRTSKQLCHHDPGPETVGSADVSNVPQIYRFTMSQSCLPGSLYDMGDPGLHPDDPAGAAHGAYGTPNGAALPFVGGLFWGPFAGGIFFHTGHLGLNPYVDHTLGSFVLHEADPNPPCEAETLYEFVTPLNLCNPDPYRGRGQSRDLRTISSVLTPIYEAKADLFEFSFDFDLSDHLLLSSQTVYSRDELFTTQDFNRFQSFPLFNDASLACGIGEVELIPGFVVPGPDCSSDPQTGRGTYPGASVLAGGEFCDPQLGCSNLLVAQDISQSSSRQYNQELRLVSSFDADLNFSLGVNLTRFETRNDYFVFANALTLLSHFFPFNYDGDTPSLCVRRGTNCTYVDPKPLREVARNPEGHNFFLSANPYELTSQAVFGEVYWQATETLKFTAGARMTWDRKVFTPVPSQLLLSDYRELEDAGFISPGDGPEDCTTIGGFCELAGTGVGGRGYPANPDIVQEWHEPTGRFVVDWSPDLAFTDESLFYASAARGYKGGGANPPPIAPPAGLINERNSGANVQPTFAAEFVNAFELGTKNTLLSGALTLNGSAFYYDYTDYQVSKIIDRSAANENFDATVWGLELEALFAPTRNLTFNAAIGYLNTRIADGEQSLDLMDRTQSGKQSYVLSEPIRIVQDDGMGGEIVTEYSEISEWMVVKPWITNSSNCIAPAVVIEAILNNVETANDGSALNGLCPGGNAVTSGFGGFEGQPGGPGVSVGDVTIFYDPRRQAPNRAQGFLADLSGNDLPNAPAFTVSLGGQYTLELPGGWDATGRVDFYWQDESYHRVYNTEYDRLNSWTSTNLSFWVKNNDWDLTVEAYVKNAFDETPITGAFLNSDDSGLTTNVFTLDPRLVGVSVTKNF